jgi:intracellular sulfur oxidation DsrE/DsrF family protein
VVNNMIENGKRLWSSMARRSFLTRLGVGAGALSAIGVGSNARAASGAASEDAIWRPARHEQDDWYDKVPGVHRFVFDTTTADGMALALRFCRNYFTANQASYGLKESDLAVVIVARHKSTSFGYNDTIWAKYGKPISEQAEFVDSKTKQPPTVNVYAAAPAAGDASETAGAMNDLIKKGVQFAVCQMATRAISGRIARATSGDADAIFKEIAANLIPNARFVPAGIVAVNRAQERGYSFVHAM